MTGSGNFDAVVVGAGPNGLAAAIRLAQEQLKVLLIEANDRIGGGARSAELTRPGFVHDLCSAIHPMGVGSPFFQSLPLERHGLQWIHPEYPLVHPLDGGRAAVMHRSLAETAEGFGGDARDYDRLFRGMSEQWQALLGEILQPIPHVPRHPVMLARFGLQALRSAYAVAVSQFKYEPARALLAGLAGHSLLPLEAPGSAAIGLVMGAAGHAVGWPMPRGGSQAISDALASHFRELGGTIETGRRVATLEELPEARAVLLGVTVRQLLRMTGDRLPSRYRRRLERFRFGPGVFKIDYAMREPVPWANAAGARAGTLHLGGRLDEIAESERTVSRGGHPERPFVLVSEASRFDSTRAPEGFHTLWAYCHVPHGSTFDMSARIEAQIERYAPGFHDCILERRHINTVGMERRNENLVGGDINGGTADLVQLFARPVFSLVPYRTPIKGLYLCSASTPPGGGVHGMSGFLAAEAALRDIFR